MTQFEIDELFDKEKLDKSIKQPMDCFIKQFNLGEKIINKLNYSPIGTIDEKFQVLIEIHQQIMENLSCIRCLIGNMYKNQAGILAATIFELSHYGIYIFKNDKALIYWNEMRGNFLKEFKNLKTIANIVRDNVTSSGKDYDSAEYDVYRQFCRFKHPHPILFGLKENGIFMNGNEVNDNNIQNCWYILHRSAMYSNYITHEILANYPRFFDDEIFDLENQFSISLKEVYAHIQENFSTWSVNPLSKK
ncbi:MAG: hypothetical protein ACJAZX_001652 [Rickettsiales bacterium]|jgi:hypothetical protein